jgi:L-threonylcarbamoyladenylate synthase
MLENLKTAVEILKKGGLILYPTDTIWGIGCDATLDDAVKKIYTLKQRHDNKSMLVLLDDANKLSNYVAEVPEIAWDILEVADGPLTIIYPNAQNLAESLIAEDGSIGIRIVKDEFCNRLLRMFGKPLVSTSANISGKPWPSNFHEIENRIVNAVDYVVKWRQNEVFHGKPSGIIKVGLNGEIKVIRE